MTNFTTETGSSFKVSRIGLRGGLMLLLLLSLWNTETFGGDQNNLTLDLLPDYHPYIPSGWNDRIVPGAEPFSGHSFVNPATMLAGDANTFFALSFGNFGDIQSSSTCFVDMMVDSRLVARIAAPMVPGIAHSWLNTTLFVSGGRHTLWQASDPDDIIVEYFEDNNNYARQWIWDPRPLVSNTQLERTNPPMPLAGHPYIPGGVARHWNKDGLRLPPATTGWWRGASISWVDNDSDYDLFVHTPTTGADVGFDDLSLIRSQHTGPLTDAVIFNRNYDGNDPYDLGVVNFTATNADYRIEYREASEPIEMGETKTGTMAEFQVLELMELNLSEIVTGTVTLDFQYDTNQDIKLVAFDPAFTKGAIYDAPFIGVPGPDGGLQIQFDTEVAGFYGVAIYRNATEGTEPFDYTLKVWPPSPDLAMVVLPGSHAPLIPRNNTVVIVGNPVPAPEILDGDTHNTSFYWHIANLGSASTELFNMDFMSDGVPLHNMVLGSWPGDPSLIHSNYMYFFSIPGGRHTSGIMLDSENSIPEINRNNNHYAEQWVWDPTQMAVDASITRSSPPVSNGGWDLIGPGVALYNNLDGLRTQTFEAYPNNYDGYWGAVALMSHGLADIDLGLYSPTTGPDNGFDTPVKSSFLGGSSTEYVLIDFEGPNSFNQAWDAGVLLYSGESDYTLQNTRSRLVNYSEGLQLPSTYGPYAIDAGEVIKLLEFGTMGFSGQVTFFLDIVHQGGDAEYGVEVFSRNNSNGFYAKGEGVGQFQDGGPGVDKTLELTLEGGQYFGLVVYKVDHDGVGKDLQFDVRFRSPGLSGTPEEQGLPSVSGIEGIYPNPFNPQTTIRLAMKQSGTASVKVYDVQGRLVRTLVEGEMGAGRHDLRWTGVDNAGRSVPSGVYFVRAVHPDGVDQQRMSLVK